MKGKFTFLVTIYFNIFSSVVPLQGNSSVILEDSQGELRVSVFKNTSLLDSGEFLFSDEIDKEKEPNGNFEQGRRGGRGYGGGASSVAFAGAGGAGGWASTGLGKGVFSPKGWGWGWTPKGGGDSTNRHYDPSQNKYGGGGPISFNPGKIGPPPLPPPPGNRGVAVGGRGVGNGGGRGGGGLQGGGGAPNSNGNISPAFAGRIVICDVSDRCHDFTHCASFAYTYLRAKERCCLLPNQISTKGMCCSGTHPQQGNSLGKHFNRYLTDKVTVPDISQSSLVAAAQKGYDYKDTYNQIEDRLIELNRVVQKGTPEYGHLLFFQTSSATIRTARDTFLTLKACNYLQDTFFLSADEAGIGLQGYDFGGTVFEKLCAADPQCNLNSRYRTPDGSCNNPRSTKLGQSHTPLLRLLPPDYADGVWAPRVRKDGTPLPSARFVSRSLVPDIDQPDPRYSHLLMQFGQFVDHDLSHVPIFRYGDHHGIQCCGRGPPDLAHPACFPIDIPPGDPYIGGECMNFVRSMIAPRLDCTFGHADQLNQLTHWLDGSQIYGNTLEHAENLREFSGGLLKVSREGHGRQDLLPEDPNEEEDCINGGGGNGLHCFLAGDKRVNEQIGLTSMHTVFLREHNRIATQLGDINPHWSDESLYQETRRIVVAEYQHIVYNEWLPIIIGREYMETFGILPLWSGHYNGYDSGIDSSVSNAFTTAALRMGHTLVQGTFNLESGTGETVGRLSLRNFFNNPHLLKEPGIIDLLNKGLLTQPIQRFDNFVTTDLRDHLFQTDGQAGMDLVALNIQRGRDHGLPGYNEYRDLCRVGKARDFSDLIPTIHPRKVASLEQIYSSVDDIDLFIGGIHETPLEGAVVGPTFACIIGDQFVRAKRGDRYFYDHGGQPHSFNTAQLETIRSASIARILCDNNDDIRSVQPLAFYLPNDGFNPTVPCGSASIPRIDLSLWRG